MSLSTHAPLAPGPAPLAVRVDPLGTVTWHLGQVEIDPADGMARLFGSFVLIGCLPALRAPAPDVLLYAPPNRRARTHLDLFPAHTWVEAQPGLWLTHDEEVLMLAPADPLIARNLRGGA